MDRRQFLLGLLPMTTFTKGQLLTADELNAALNEKVTAADLANASSGDGVDLVANATKKVPTYAAVRQLSAPQGSESQTLIVDGASTANDGLGDDFIWNATDSSADDGKNVLNPNSAPATGRWNRLKRFILSATGAVARYIQDKLSERVSVEDFGASTSNTPAQNSTCIQAAMDYARLHKRNLWFNGYYQIDTPLVATGSNGDTDTSGVHLRGHGKTQTGFYKTTHTTYPASGGVDCLIYIQMPAGATYGANVSFKGLIIQGDIAGDQTTNLCAYGAYVANDFTQLHIHDCYINGAVSISTAGNLWQSSFKRILMHPKNKGIEMQGNGTSNRLENCFVQSAQVAAYDLRGEYSSASALACDGATGWAYKFTGGAWDISGLGSESTNVANGQIYAYNCRLTIRAARLFHPASDSAELIHVESGCNVVIDGLSIGNYTGNTTASGWLYNYTTNSALTIKNVEWDSVKRFAHKPAPNSSVSVTLEHPFPMYGKMMQRENLILLAGAGQYHFDEFLGAPSILGAGIFAGGSDTNPASDNVTRADDGIPARSIVLNTRGSGNPFGWLCTATGAAISNCTFVPWLLEETFNPVVQGSTTAGACTYSTQTGAVKQTGNAVHFIADVSWSGHTGTGALQLAGLPVSSGFATAVTIRTANVVMPAGTVIQGYISGNIVYFEAQPTGGGSAPSLALPASGSLTVSGTFFPP